jgi:hypothetical protein
MLTDRVKRLTAQVVELSRGAPGAGMGRDPPQLAIAREPPLRMSTPSRDSRSYDSSSDSDDRRYHPRQRAHPSRSGRYVF